MLQPWPRYKRVTWCGKGLRPSLCRSPLLYRISRVLNDTKEGRVRHNRIRPSYIGRSSYKVPSDMGATTVHFIYRRSYPFRYKITSRSLFILEAPAGVTQDEDQPNRRFPSTFLLRCVLKSQAFKHATKGMDPFTLGGAAELKHVRCM